VLAGLLTFVVNVLITTPFSATNWFGQAVAAAAATVIILPYTTLVGVLLYLACEPARSPSSLDTLRANLQSSAA
jgi:hypothetical protein